MSAESAVRGREAGLDLTRVEGTNNIRTSRHGECDCKEGGRPLYDPCQTTSSGSRYFIHNDTQGNCRTSKCSARQVECHRCESAKFTHCHHVHAACPFDFSFCKKLAADAKFKEEFARMAARKEKEETEKLQKTPGAVISQAQLPSATQGDRLVPTESFYPF